ncbi:MAG TPA: M1 family metallopeptidase, partial [Opitutaceae bacterium]
MPTTHAGGPMRAFHKAFLLLFAAAACSRAADSPIVLPTNAVATAYDIAVQPDIAGLTFRASAVIHLDIKDATASVVVNALDLVIDKAELQGLGATPAVSYDSEQQTATFTFPRKLEAGSYLLALEYHGTIYEKSSGLFALDYDSPSGKKRALFTQFESTDARRFVPCWDEPAQKATFNLTVTAPTGLMAVSNMPVASIEPAGTGRQRVRFATTPRMSPYLLFLALGDFESIHRDVEGVDVGVVVKRGDTANGQYALDTACNILAYYNDYFGTPYPLPKLDLVAGPGTSQFFSAMENWGAIFYFESAILFDPRISTEDDRRNVHETIAHEMAHQWFGDLVTMKWWDNIWLNEGFASWMQEKATDHFHPEWKVWLDTLSSKQSAMQTDARDGTHPVIVPIHDILQAANSFDVITYSKGHAVIRMLEAYVGEDAFRAGVRRYMKDYAYGNTETDQLWSEIDAGSDRKLTGVAHDFTLRAGVPMVTVSEAGKGISLRQDRFAYDASGASGGAWSIPTTIQTGNVGAPSSTLQVVAGPDRTTVVANAPPGSVVNAGQTAYYRVLYEGKAFTAMSERFGSLPPDDQIGILNDAFSIGCSGKEPLSDLLRVAVRLPADAYPSVWSTLASRLQSIDVAYDGLSTQEAYRLFARSLL